MATSGIRAALIPTLMASDRPLFDLRSTTSGVRPSRGTATHSTCARTGISSGTRRGISTRLNAVRSRS